jgi:hypothetical protein
MGEATDRKVMEIEETRRQLELDLRELESRVPAPLRSLKSLAGIVVGSTVLTALFLRMFRSKRSGERPSTEVVVRIVRDDL